MKTNPDVHIICGKCGCHTMFSYNISKDIDDETDKPILVVYLYCENCGTLTGLDELMKEK